MDMNKNHDEIHPCWRVVDADPYSMEPHPLVQSTAIFKQIQVLVGNYRLIKFLQDPIIALEQFFLPLYIGMLESAQKRLSQTKNLVGAQKCDTCLLRVFHIFRGCIRSIL